MLIQCSLLPNEGEKLRSVVWPLEMLGDESSWLGTLPSDLVKCWILKRINEIKKSKSKLITSSYFFHVFNLYSSTLISDDW